MVEKSFQNTDTQASKPGPGTDSGAVVVMVLVSNHTDNYTVYNPQWNICKVSENVGDYFLEPHFFCITYSTQSQQTPRVWSFGKTNVSKVKKELSHTTLNATRSPGRNVGRNAQLHVVNIVKRLVRFRQEIYLVRVRKNGLCQDNNTNSIQYRVAVAM